MITFVFIILNGFLLAVGQVFLKLGVSKFGGVSLEKIFQVLFSPLVMSGLFCSALATILWLYILSKGNLSILYPLTSLSFVFTALLSRFILQETISITTWFGIFVIFIGISLVASR